MLLEFVSFHFALVNILDDAYNCFFMANKQLKSNSRYIAFEKSDSTL